MMPLAVQFFAKNGYFSRLSRLGRTVRLEPWRLPFETRELVNFYGVKSIVKIAAASGNGSEKVLLKGLPIFSTRIVNPQDLTDYGLSLAEIGVVVEDKDGYLFDAVKLFRDQIAYSSDVGT